MYHWNRTVFDRNGALVEIGFYDESRVSGENMSTLTVIDVGVRDEGRYTCFVSINRTNTGGSTAILSTQGEVIIIVHSFSLYMSTAVCVLFRQYNVI